MHRCYREADAGFSYYGGRGITVCRRWHVFVNFLADMGVRPKSMSIERKDNNGNYEFNNCKWATKIEQSRNTRRNVFLDMDGKRLTVVEWAEEKGMRAGAIRWRIQAGWSARDALTLPVGQKKGHYHGIEL